MTGRNFFVEVRTTTPRGEYITAAPTRDWNHSLQVAQDTVLKMFREDPMADRCFRNGFTSYENRNDFGDSVRIRIRIQVEDDMKLVGETS